MSEISGGPLNRFLQMVGYEYDLVRSKAEALRSSNNPELCPGDLLPLLAAELGVQYENHLGMAQNRQLLANLATAYQQKGSVAGLQTIVQALTGWASTVAIGPNLANTTFSEPRAVLSSPTILSAPMGMWMGASSQPGPTFPLAWYTAGNVGSLWSYPFTGYQSSAPIPATLYFPTAAGSNWTNGASYVDFNTAMNPTTQVADPNDYGITLPSGSTAISASVYVGVVGTMTVTFHLLLEFFDQYGNSLGLAATTDTHAYAPVGNFDTYKVQNVPVPNNAARVAQHLRMYTTGSGDIVSGLGTGVVVAGPMVNVGTTLLSYVPPRETLVTLLADRENIVANPSFEGNSTTGWTGTNCTLAVQSGTYYVDTANLATNNYCLKVTASASGTVSVTTSLMTIDNAVRWWSASAYSKPAATARQVSIAMNFYDSTGTNLLGTVNGLSISEVLNSWARPIACTEQQTSVSFNVSPPQNIGTQLGGSINSNWASYISKVLYATVTVSWASCAANEVHYLDAVMMEKADQPGVYFDGDYYDALYINYSDYQWAGGVAHTGPSYFYRGFEYRFNRLDQVLSGTDPTAGAIEVGVNPNLIVPAAPVQATPYPYNGQILWSWAPPTSDGGAPILGYNVYIGTATGAESTTPVNGSTLIPYPQFVTTDLANGTTYYLTVKAVNALGSSVASNEKSTAPLLANGLPTTHYGPGHLVTVWEVPGSYNNPTIGASSGLVQYSGKKFGTGTGPLGIIWVRSQWVPPGVLVNA